MCFLIAALAFCHSQKNESRSPTQTKSLTKGYSSELKPWRISQKNKEELNELKQLAKPFESIEHASKKIIQQWGPLHHQEGRYFIWLAKTDDELCCQLKIEAVDGMVGQVDFLCLGKNTQFYKQCVE